MSHRTYILLSFLLLMLFVPTLVGSSLAKPSVEKKQDGGDLDFAHLLNSHILDAHTWHFFDGGTLYLPIILYTEQGLVVFSSHHLFDQKHQPIAYQGYRLVGEKIVADNGQSVWDFSITKTVLFLFIEALLLLIGLVWVARQYARRTVPRGFQNAIEVMVLFVRDEIVKPCMGNKTDKYLPYLLTLFFFILVGNLMGLLPGAANLTGNIAVTMTLAGLTFILTNISGKSMYWQHVFNMPGVPLFIKPLMGLVEFVGLFTKPISLMVRLFVAITAGHIVILSLIGLIFIFQSYMVGIFSTMIVLFVTGIELLVSAVQAYVFTMFSALYIGMAVNEDDH